MDTDDGPLRIHDEGGAIGDSRFLIQHAIKLRHLAIMVGGEREIRPQLLRPMIQRGNEVRANGDYLCFRIFEFANTRLVGGELSRSTSGKRGRKECQHDVLLTPVIGKLERGVVGRGQREIGCLVANLEIGVLAALFDLLSRK